MIPENLTTSQPAMKTPHQRPGNFQSHEESRGKAAEKHRLMGVQMVRSAAFSKSPRPRNSQAPYMTDCCQDKTSPYEIRPEEKDLFAAAIVFGDWLAEFPAASRDEIAAIREMQTFLRNLPSAPSPNFNAESLLSGYKSNSSSWLEF